MTTDPFTEAVEQAAEQSRDEVLGGPWNGQYDANYIRGFESGAEWARTHLAAQEPSDDEVYAVRMATHGVLSPAAARAALSAARKASKNGG